MVMTFASGCPTLFCVLYNICHDDCMFRGYPENKAGGLGVRRYRSMEPIGCFSHPGSGIVHTSSSSRNGTTSAKTRSTIENNDTRTRHLNKILKRAISTWTRENKGEKVAEDFKIWSLAATHQADNRLFIPRLDSDILTGAIHSGVCLVLPLINFLCRQ
jgi:hypothetical protein